uniref:G_PROTEIN_RECEP_F1_2 domain-containing protein n=1 Tax=Caenorhabditis japonica TaxID=281687 RepID=A0A8R1HYT3_CAEJA
METESVVSSTTTITTSLQSEEEICGFYEGYSTQRFIIISGCTTVAFFGVLANLLLMAVFRRSLPSSIFLAALATCDTLICLTYLLLFGVDAGIVYLKNTTLFFLYHRYIVPVFFVAKVVQFAIPFILILITFERYLWTCTEPKRKTLAAIFNERGRIFTVVFVCLTSVGLRFPVLYAIKVESFPDCKDYFRSESMAQTDWAMESELYRVFDFHVITAIQMIFPFVILLFLNLTIIQRLVAEKRENLYPVLRGSSGPSSEAKKVSFVQGNLPENYVLLQVAADVIKESLIRRYVLIYCLCSCLCIHR